MAVRISTPHPSILRRHFFPEMALAHEWCVGKGIEFGAAAHNPFGLPGCENFAPFSDVEGSVDAEDFKLYKNAQEELCGSYALIDKRVDADSTGEASESVDYVISSHVIEHLPNLIAAFVEWQRIVRTGGTIFMIFPKRNAAPADAHRSLTPLLHFIQDYEQHQTYRTHSVEHGHGIRGHYHVFSLDSMLALIDECNKRGYINWAVVAVEETDSKVGNGHTVVCGKVG